VKQAIWSKVSEEIRTNRDNHHDNATKTLNEVYVRSQKYALKPLTTEEQKKLKK
jgi:hypothetical protein